MRMFLILLAFIPCSLVLAGTPSPSGARVYIISPAEGEVVSSPVRVLFGLEEMGIAPAQVSKRNTGHHHLLIDVDSLPPVDDHIPSDDHHLHFGGGQTQTDLILPPGTHTLQLLLGDHQHRPHSPPLFSEKVTIEVR